MPNPVGTVPLTGDLYQRSEPSVPLLVRRAIVDATLLGDNEVVAAVAGQRIRVISLFYFCAGTVTVRFESAAGGAPITGQMEHTAQTGAVLARNVDGWLETAVGAALNLELSAAISVDGCLNYVLVR